MRSADPGGGGRVIQVSVTTFRISRRWLLKGLVQQTLRALFLVHGGRRLGSIRLPGSISRMLRSPSSLGFFPLPHGFVGASFVILDLGW